MKNIKYYTFGDIKSSKSWFAQIKGKHNTSNIIVIRQVDALNTVSATAAVV